MSRLPCLVVTSLLWAMACACGSGDAGAPAGSAPPPYSGGAEDEALPEPEPSAMLPGVLPPSALPSDEGLPSQVSPGAGGAAGSANSGGLEAPGSTSLGGGPSTAQGGSAAEQPVPAPSAPRSAGCGRQNPPRGAASLSIRGAQADYVVTLPNGYDANTPVPLVFGFHGRGRTHVQFQTVDASGIQAELGSRAVMVYMKSQGGTGWNFAAEVPPSVEFFDALYPQVLGNYCVDTSRIYAVGHSSGAYFSHILACRYGSRFRAVGDVAGALQETNCTSGQVAALLVHGVRDTVVPYSGGQAIRDLYLSENGCSTSTAAGVAAQCRAYTGCDAPFPVQWCEHSEATYDNTNHGWPSFASRAINQFFLGLSP